MNQPSFKALPPDDTPTFKTKALNLVTAHKAPFAVIIMANKVLP